MARAMSVTSMVSNVCSQLGATAHAFAVRFRRRARGFAEIPGHVRVQAVRGTAVADHRVEQPAFRRAYGLLLFGSQSFVFVIRIEQPAAGDDVRFVPQQRAAAWFAVSSGATRLLVVRFRWSGHVVVDDEPHVGFVDAPAETRWWPPTTGTRSVTKSRCAFSRASALIPPW